jgi:hypothetical protein
MRPIKATIVSLVVIAAASIAVASPHHHGGRKHCRPTAAERATAAAFVAAVKQGIGEYEQVSLALLEGYRTDGMPTNSVMHYDSEEARRDGEILDPEAPESLVYANSRRGPKLLGALFTMGRPGVPGPRFGGCLTRWHTHAFCKSSAGVNRPASAGKCPPGFEVRRTGEMIHTWVVPMKGGPFAHSADERYRCWLRDIDC